MTRIEQPDATVESANTGFRDAIFNQLEQSGAGSRIDLTSGLLEEDAALIRASFGNEGIQIGNHVVVSAEVSLPQIKNGQVSQLFVNFDRSINILAEANPGLVFDFVGRYETPIKAIGKLNTYVGDARGYLSNPHLNSQTIEVGIPGGGAFKGIVAGLVKRGTKTTQEISFIDPADDQKGRDIVSVLKEIGVISVEG